MKQKYTSYVTSGVLAMIVLLLSTTPIMASPIEIYSNPTGATVTMAYTGQYLGSTPLYIDPAAYPSPTFLRLSKTGYQSINVPIYSWMTTSLSYNLQPLSAPAPAPAPIPASAPAPAPAPAPTRTSTPFLYSCPDGRSTAINTKPEGAAVYDHANQDIYVGTTPFCRDMSTGNLWGKFVLSGYQTGYVPIWSSYRPPQWPYLNVDMTS